MNLSPGISYIDLEFQGSPRVIATAVLQGAGGIALIDPGPSSSLPTLTSSLERAGIGIADLSTILITHIHLDHAGAVGTMVRQNPRLKVYVHERGAPHMIDPEKLLASATWLYGDAMDRLWGEVAPVPSSAIVSLRGGERVDEGGRRLEVEYTPGHASHHVSYFASDAGIAFVGDTAGVKVLPNGQVLPPTPPPDIDLELWEQSFARIERWHPDTIFLTHFGPAAPVAPHVSELRESLQQAAQAVKQSLEEEGSDEERENRFVERWRHQLRQRFNESDARTYETAGRFDLNWRGLARYWRKRTGA